MAEGDEYYYPLSFKDKKDPDFFLEILGRMPYTHRSQSQRYEYVEKQGYPPTFVDAIIKNEQYRKEQLLNYAGFEELKSQSKFSDAVNDMEQPKVFEVLKTLHEQPKKKVGISNQQVCILTCVDPSRNTFAEPVCVGRIAPRHIEKSLVPHFTQDTLLVTDSHSAYKSVANKHKIPLRQIPSGKYTSGGYHLGHVNGYHHNISMLEDQAYEIINLLSMQANRIPLNNFKDIPLTIDLKGILDCPQMA